MQFWSYSNNNKLIHVYNIWIKQAHRSSHVQLWEGGQKTHKCDESFLTPFVGISFSLYVDFGCCDDIALDFFGVLIIAILILCSAHLAFFVLFDAFQLNWLGQFRLPFFRA